MLQVTPNNVLVTDCTIREPGFDLPRQSWSLLNHCRTGQDRCLCSLHKWGLASSDLCMCVASSRPGVISLTCVRLQNSEWTAFLREAGDDAIHWLESTTATALAK